MPIAPVNDQQLQEARQYARARLVEAVLRHRDGETDATISTQAARNRAESWSHIVVALDSPRRTR